MTDSEQLSVMPSAEELRRDVERSRALLSARESGLLELLWDCELATASELASQLGYTPQALNNHLKALIRVGFLERQRQTVPGGGAEWAYWRAER